MRPAVRENAGRCYFPGCSVENNFKHKSNSCQHADEPYFTVEMRKKRSSPRSFSVSRSSDFYLSVESHFRFSGLGGDCESTDRK